MELWLASPGTRWQQASDAKSLRPLACSTDHSPSLWTPELGVSPPIRAPHYGQIHLEIRANVMLWLPLRPSTQGQHTGPALNFPDVLLTPSVLDKWASLQILKLSLCFLAPGPLLCRPLLLSLSLLTKGDLSFPCSWPSLGSPGGPAAGDAGVTPSDSAQQPTQDHTLPQGFRKSLSPRGTWAHVAAHQGPLQVVFLRRSCWPDETIAGLPVVRGCPHPVLPPPLLSQVSDPHPVPEAFPPSPLSFAGMNLLCFPFLLGVLPGGSDQHTAPLCFLCEAFLQPPSPGSPGHGNISCSGSSQRRFSGSSPRPISLPDELVCSGSTGQVLLICSPRACVSCTKQVFCEHRLVQLQMCAAPQGPAAVFQGQLERGG